MSNKSTDDGWTDGYMEECMDDLAGWLMDR